MKPLFTLVFSFLISAAIAQKQPLVAKVTGKRVYIEHNVSKGETYNSIGLKYHLEGNVLADFNDVSFYEGQVLAKILQIPLTAANFKTVASKFAAAQPIYYKVRTGETLADISNRFDISAALLRNWNSIKDNKIAVGQLLKVGYLKVESNEASNVSSKPTEDVEVKQPVYVEESAKANETATEILPKKIQSTTTDEQEKVAQGKPAETNSEQSKEKAYKPGIKDNNKLKVYIDCSNTYCDETYIRSEINIVDFLLDRVASDVHVLITNQQNGSGGSSFQLIFYGQNKFKNITDTLRYTLEVNATDDESRKELVQFLKLGLTPFVAKTGYARSIDIKMKGEEKGTEDEAIKNTTDRWNYWVFRIGADGNVSAEESYKNYYYNGSVSANRTTDKIKIGFSASGTRSFSSYPTYNYKNSSYNFDHYLVKSISDHWSNGYELTFSNSTFSNNKFRSYLRAGIEYSIFPYKEVNNKFLTISYSLDARKNKYFDTTIFNKTEETLFGHTLAVGLSLNQKWGNINSGVSYHNYFNNWQLTNLGVNVNISVRITGGLSFYGYGYGGLTRDQLFLPKESATEQEILTRQRQLASSYNFYSGFGLTYRFGSKLNNFINPRFQYQ